MGGRTAPDPWHFPPPCCASNAYTRAEVAPGETEELRIDLAKYAWLDAPGTYTVRLLAPFGNDRTDVPPPSNDPRWVETRVTLVPPPDPVALVEAIPTTIDAARAGPERLPHMDLNTYDALGHVTYVPILERLAADGRMDERALYGFGACPCEEATEALLRLYDHFGDPERREVVAAELLRRSSRPGKDVSWFQTQVWTPGLESEVVARARAAMNGPTGVQGWGDRYDWGANVLHRRGDASDRELLQRAVERVLAGNEDYVDGANGRAMVVQTLNWALSELGGTTSTMAASGDAKLLLDLNAWDGRTGDPPPGWEAVVIPALHSDDSAIVANAMGRLPWPASPALADAIVPHIGSEEGLVSGYHRRVVRRRIGRTGPHRRHRAGGEG